MDAIPLDWLRHPPKFVADLLPGPAREHGDLIWYGIVGGGALLILLILLLLVRALFGGKKSGSAKAVKLTERLADYPPLPPGSGDRRLLVEGTPVRLRLVVLAPSGQQSRVDVEAADQILERVLLGLQEIVHQDRPRVKVWPRQVSYEGFARTFHRETIRPEREGEASPWVLLAGRAKLGKYQVMVGLALQGVKPNTIGNRVVEADEWANLLRIRVRD